MEAINPTPTQVSHPWRAALRTGLWTALTVAGALVLALPMVAEFVEQFWPGSPVVAFIGTVTAVLAGAVVLVNRVMTIPVVNDWLTQLGIGATSRN